MRRYFHAILAAALCVLFSSSAAFAQCQYEITAIISPDDEDACWPFPPSNTFPQGMNENGEVVGYYVPCAVGNEKAFYWSQETGFVTLPQPPGAVQAYASDINDHGYIVGQHVYSGVGSKGYIYNPRTGEFKYLEPLHKSATATFLTAANAINNQNTVVGDRVITEPGESPVIRNAVIWHPYSENGNGREVVIDLGVMNGPNSWAISINDVGEMVGTTGTQFTSSVEAWLFTSGHVFLLGAVPGGLSSVANDINEGGVVAGGTHLPPGPPGWPTSQGALWNNGTWELLSLMPDAIGGSAFAVNDLGQAAGRIIFPGSVHRASLWQHGIVHEIIDLVIDVPRSAALRGANAMNNAGQILIVGSLGGKTVGFVLSAADRPLSDLNADCVTDVHDLLKLLESWGPCESSECPGDFTGSGQVGVPDLLFLLSNWG